MAISNAIGSQIINILIGLGLPWLLTDLAGVATGVCVKLYAHGALQLAAFLQFGAVFLVLASLLGLAFIMRKNKAILTKMKARVFICVYAGVIITYTIVEAVARPTPATTLSCPKQ